MHKYQMVTLQKHIYLWVQINIHKDKQYQYYDKPAIHNSKHRATQKAYITQVFKTISNNKFKNNIMYLLTHSQEASAQ